MMYSPTVVSPISEGGGSMECNYAANIGDKLVTTEILDEKDPFEYLVEPRSIFY